MKFFEYVFSNGEGVCVCVCVCVSSRFSTPGSLETLLDFPAVKSPVSGINIGPLHKHDVMRANVMLQR